MKATIVTLLVVTFLYTPSIAQKYDALNASSRPAEDVAAPSSAVVTSELVWSEKVNDEFKLFISLPPGYDSLRLEKYPVVYYLDGGSNTFHNINAAFMAQQLIPQVITIGIGYSGATQRTRDYTYGFMNFYQFLKQELIPMMDKKYHTDPLNRTLFGHSYGGICVLFILFEYTPVEDILFHNLIAASPSIWYDDQIAFVRERNLYEQTHIMPVNLYMSVGSLEGFMVSDMNRMKQTLLDHNYQYLTLSCHVYEGKDHSTNKEITFRDGIQWVMNQEILRPTQVTPSLIAQATVASSLYPNPVTNQLNLLISPSVNLPVTCRINDGKGTLLNILENQHPQEQVLKIQVSHLPKGLYIIQLISGARQQTLKFIK